MDAKQRDWENLDAVGDDWLKNHRKQRLNNALLNNDVDAGYLAILYLIAKKYGTDYDEEVIYKDLQILIGPVEARIKVEMLEKIIEAI